MMDFQSKLPKSENANSQSQTRSEAASYPERRMPIDFRYANEVRHESTNDDGLLQGRIRRRLTNKFLHDS